MTEGRAERGGYNYLTPDVAPLGPLAPDEEDTLGCPMSYPDPERPLMGVGTAGGGILRANEPTREGKTKTGHFAGIAATSDERTDGLRGG